MGNFATIDFLVIGGYFVLILVVGLLIKSSGRSTTDYFLAGRNIGWFVVGASMFASNFGSEHVLGNTQSGFESGLAAGHFEWMACIVLVFMSWFVVPFLIKSKVFTVPEFIEKRFDKRSRYYLSIVSILAYIITKVSVTLYAGGIILKSVIGWDLYSSALLFTLATGVYAIVGGLRAVIYTEAIQGMIVTVGGLVIAIFSISNFGGLETIEAQTPSSFWSMFRGIDDPNFPWTGIVFGAPILAIWYWCTDQYIVQKVLSSKNVKTARRGVIFAGYLKVLPVFAIMLPGMIVYAMNVKLPEGSSVYGYLITHMLPTGLKGLAIAVLLAALMSSLAASFSGASALFTFDVYKKIFPKSTDFQLFSIGRIATFAIVIFGIVWVPFLSNISGNLITYLQSVQAYISPPIAAIFLMGLFWKRSTGSASFYVLVVGGIMGIARFVLEMFKVKSDVALFDWLIQMNFLHFAIFLFVFSILLMFIISYSTKLDESKDYTNLTISKLDGGFAVQESKKSYYITLFASLILVSIVTTLWIIFR